MKRRNEDPWNFLFIAGMWFQDLFNYDFRRTEMCIIPYATQQGEISFCAYNTGVGWRKIIENMHKNATVAQWYKEHGKHEIYAKGKKVDLMSYEHSLRIDDDDAARVRHLEHDIPQTAAEEDRIRRKKAFEEAAKVRRIYEELVLKKPQETVVQIGSIQQIQMAVPGAAVKPVQIAPANERQRRRPCSRPKPRPSPATKEFSTLPSHKTAPRLKSGGCCTLEVQFAFLANARFPHSYFRRRGFSTGHAFVLSGLVSVGFE